MTDNPPFAEVFWGGYLQHALENGHIHESDDIAAMKRDFMAGLRGETDD